MTVTQGDNEINARKGNTNDSRPPGTVARLAMSDEMAAGERSVGSAWRASRAAAAKNG